MLRPLPLRSLPLRALHPVAVLPSLPLPVPRGHAFSVSLNPSAGLLPLTFALPFGQAAVAPPSASPAGVGGLVLPHPLGAALSFPLAFGADECADDDDEGGRNEYHHSHRHHSSNSQSSSSSSSSSSTTTNPLWWVAAFGKAHPLLFAATVATVKTAGADAVAQAIDPNFSGELDWDRVKLYAGFGLVYLGCWQYFMFVVMFRRMFPNAVAFAAKTVRGKARDLPGLKQLAQQVAVNNFVLCPFVFFPAYNLAREFALGEPGRPLSERVAAAADNYRQNIVSDLTTLWKMWLVGDVLVFGVPVWARVPTGQILSFLYILVLSSMRGGKEGAPAVAAAATSQKRP